MITDKGTIKVSTVMNDDVHRELNHTNYILSIIYIVIGAVLLVAYIALETIFEDSPLFGDYFICCVLGVMLLVFGIIVLLGHKKNLALMRSRQQVEEHEFFGDHFICREYEFGELVSVNKLYYGRIVRKRETKSFIFLYNTNVTALAIDKRTIDFSELSAIRALLNKVGSPACMGPQSTAPYNPPAAPFTPPETHAATPPPDPFDQSAKTDNGQWKAAKTDTEKPTENVIEDTAADTPDKDSGENKD
ncbi:MAG: YcxB family protein [Clostridia bacterium]|nr:YcxB family protein [Clostridia bacterium]